MGWRASASLIVVLASAAGAATQGCDDADVPVAPIDTQVDATPDTSTEETSAADGGSWPDASEGVSVAPFVWNLPPGFPTPVVPTENPMSAAKVTLGRRLFYDTRLSKNQTQSCASCHKQALAFTDGLAQSVGSTGMSHPRSAMSLANVAYASTLTWANPLQVTLERQALVPMFGDDPVELGLTDAQDLIDRLAAEPVYAPLFQAAYPDDPQPISLEHVTQSLASFQRTLLSGNSPYDKWQRGDTAAISEAAKRGYALFNSESFECFHCHVGFDLSDHVHYTNKPFFDKPFHNTGLYNVGGTGAYPAPNTGLENVTKKAADMGRFKAPTLRNVAVTAPYMHDGSIATLEEVLDHYVAGGRTIASGPHAGNGSVSPYKDPIIKALVVTTEQRADLIEFLKTLTDDTFLNDPAFSNPW